MSLTFYSTKKLNETFQPFLFLALVSNALVSVFASSAQI